jgi:hypothetical protein
MANGYGFAICHIEAISKPFATTTSWSDNNSRPTANSRFYNGIDMALSFAIHILGPRLAFASVEWQMANGYG